MSVKVRLATPDDEPALMDLCRALHADNGLFKMDDDMVRGMLHRAFDRQGGIIGVIDGKDQIAAAIFVLISNFWYSRDNHLEELFNFIRPEYRKSNYATSMIEFACECANKIGIPLVIGILTHQRMLEKVRLYRRKLGVPAGAFFVHNSSWKNDCDNIEIFRHTRGRNRKKKAA